MFREIQCSMNKLRADELRDLVRGFDEQERRMREAPDGTWEQFEIRIVALLREMAERICQSKVAVIN
jgi:hypothetical protein